MADRTRSCRAPKAEIDEITRPPLLVERAQIAPGLEIWNVGLAVGYHLFADPETRLTLDNLVIQLILGRVPDRKMDTRPLVDVMIVGHRCFSADFQSEIIGWAQEEWGKFYGREPSTTPVVTEWFGSPTVNLRHRTYRLIDHNADQFDDTCIIDSDRKEWSVGRSMVLTIADVEATAKVSTNGEMQQVRTSTVVMVEDNHVEITEVEDRLWVFFPIEGTQIRPEPALEIVQIVAMLRQCPRPAEGDGDPFAE